MKIGIVGAGVVGSNLGQGWAKVGHHVMLSSRDPQGAEIQATIAQIGANAQAGTVQQTLAFADMIVVAIGWNYLPSVVKDAGDWTNKIVMDTTNRFSPSASGKSAAEDLADLLGKAHVVKAFNTIGAEHMQHGTLNGEQLSMFIAGDDLSVKGTIAQLVADLGFAVVDTGGLSNAKLLENLAQLWVSLAHSAYGRNIGFRLVQG